jgi:type III restriction enzyme
MELKPYQPQVIKSSKTTLLETKGDHLDAEKKIRLGGLWAGKAHL